MAPTFESLQERLSLLQQATSEARELIARLEAYDPAYADEDDQVLLNTATSSSGANKSAICISNSDEYAAELAAETIQLLEDQRDELEEIEEEVKDFDSSRSHDAPREAAANDSALHEKARLIDGVRKAKDALRMTKRDFRSAQQIYVSRTRTTHLRYRDAYLNEVLAPLCASAVTPSRPSTSSAGTSSDAGAHLPSAVVPATQRLRLPDSAPTSRPLTPIEARRLLLAGPHLRPQSRAHSHSRATTRKLDHTASDNNSSKALTASLQRLHTAMSTSLERSSFAQRIMDESSASLRQLGSQYDSLDSLLAKSKGLLGVLMKSAKSDAWYLQTAVYILLVTLAWLVFRRWIYGPAWWFVWLPFRIIVIGGAKVGGISGLT